MKKLIFILSVIFYSSVIAQDLSNIKIVIYPYSNLAEGNMDNYIKAKFYEKLLNNFGADVIVIDNRNNNLPLSQVTEIVNKNKVDFIHFIYNKDLIKSDDEKYSLVIYNSFEEFDVENAGKFILDGIANSNRVDNKYLSDENENDLSGNFFIGLNAPGIISTGSEMNLQNKPYKINNPDYLKHEAWGFVRGIVNFYDAKVFSMGFLAGYVKDKNEKISAESSNVINDFKPINNFKISLIPTNKTYVGDFNNNGFFYFDSLEPGDYKLIVEAGTYSADSILTTVYSNQTSFSDIYLQKDYSIPPSVFNHFPYDTTKFLDTEASIKIVFSIPMDQESTEDAFSIVPDIDGKFNWSNEDHVLNFIPEKALDTTTTYEIIIDSTAKGKNNISLDTPTQFRFTTMNKFVEVALNNMDEIVDSAITTQLLEFKFSKPMDKNETEDAFEIEPEVEGHFEWSADFTKMRFIPDEAYLTSTIYKAIIDENAETFSGLELGYDFIFEFITRTSHIQPKIISASPNINSDDVFINTEIAIEFNEEMSINNTDEIFTIEPKVEGKFEWDITNSKMKFIPNQLLSPATKYSVQIFNSAKNKYGIPFVENYQFSFTTNNRGRLQLVKNYPVSNQKDISTTSKMKLVFNYPVESSVLQNNVSLIKSTGEDVKLTLLSMEEKEGKITTYFDHEENLKNDAEYNLFLSKEIKDNLDIPLLDDITIKFKTERRTTFAGDIVDEFEDISNWRRIDSINSSYGIDKGKTFFELSDEKVVSGKSSGKISYKFNKDKGILKLDRSKQINILNVGGETGIWIYGDLSYNTLHIKVVNESAEFMEIILDTLNWSGWKLKKFNIPEQVVNNLQLNSILLKHSSKGENEGSIYFDDLQVTKTNNLTKTEETIPNEFSLEQNYPNPFNPVTKISFRIPAPTVVSLEVLNILGQKVRSLIHKENYGAGTWSIEWDGKSDYGEFMPSGVYLYKLRAAEFTEVKKMILVK